jgi:hypothetical protein
MCTHAIKTLISLKSFSAMMFSVLIGGCQVDITKPKSPKITEITQQAHPATRSEWRNLLRWSDDCEQSFSNTQAGDYSGIEAHAIGEADQLIIVMCAVGGYQPSFLLYRLKQQKSSTLTLETYLSTDGQNLQAAQESELWGEPIFMAESKELVILNVARQTRDCGTWAKYGFSSDTAILLSFYALVPCPMEFKESVSLNPDNPPNGWKQIFNK